MRRVAGGPFWACLIATLLLGCGGDREVSGADGEPGDDGQATEDGGYAGESCTGYTLQRGSIHFEEVLSVEFGPDRDAVYVGWHADEERFSGDAGEFVQRPVLGTVSPEGVVSSELDLPTLGGALLPLQRAVLTDQGVFVAGPGERPTLARIGLDGQLAWSARLEHPTVALAATPEGGVVAAGTGRYEVGAGSAEVVAAQYTRLGPDGELLQAVAVEPPIPGAPWIKAMDLDCDGSPLLALDIEPDPADPRTGGGYLTRYDAAGEQVWGTGPRAQLGEKIVHAVGTSCDAPVYALVEQRGVTPGTWVQAFDTTGGLLWSVEVPAKSAATARMVVDGRAQVVLSVAVDSEVAPGQTATLVRSFDRAGSVMWSETLDTGTWERVNALAVSAESERVLAGGFTHGSLSADNKGDSDHLLVELCP